MGDLELQDFANRLKQLRTKLGLTQKEFSDKIKITASALSAYETNTKNPSIAVAKRISESFGVSIDWLCGLSDKMSNENSIKTYSDAIRLLLDLQSISNLNVEFIDTQYLTIVLMGFDNEIINKFLQDWIKIKRLYDDGTISKDMFDPWLKTKLEELDKDIELSHTGYLDELIGNFNDFLKE